MMEKGRFDRNESVKRERGWERDALHAFRAAPFVAVVEIEAFALQDECAYAILEMDGIISIFDRVLESKRTAANTYLGGRCRSESRYRHPVRLP